MTKWALITGASQGIGYELAKIAADDGYYLILVGRTKERLVVVTKELETRHVKIIVCIKDLVDPNAAKEIYQSLKERDITINMLINNAGFGVFGKFLDTDLKENLDMVQVNLVALTELTHLIAKDMVSHKKGAILNVASTAAFLPIPYMSIYAATKAYVLSFTEALASELEGTGVSVTALCPGPTKTGFHKRAKVEHVQTFKKMMDAKTVAKIGYEAMKKGKTVAIPGVQNKTFSLLTKITPRKITTHFARKIQEKRKQN